MKIIDSLFAFIANRLSNIGTVLNENGGSSSISVANSTPVNVAQITLPEGTWLVTTRISFPTNANGTRSLAFSSTSQYTTAHVKTMASPTGATVLSYAYIIEVVSSPKIYYLVAQQGSGSTLSLSGASQVIRAVQIA